MKQREAELTKLEERVAKLRAQLDRRKKSKAEITQLQTKVLVNEIDGLGFSHPRPLNADDVRAGGRRQPHYPNVRRFRIPIRSLQALNVRSPRRLALFLADAANAGN